MSMRLMVIGCLKYAVTAAADNACIAFVFQKTNTRSDIATIEFLKLHTAVETLRTMT